MKKDIWQRNREMLVEYARQVEKEEGLPPMRLDDLDNSEIKGYIECIGGY